MFGIKYIKAQPTTYLLQYRLGKVVREGMGLSFFYYGPTTSLVAVPVASTDTPFIFEETTADFQTVIVQGQVTYRVSDPRQLASLLNYTLGKDGETYLSDDPEKSSERVMHVINVLARAELQRLPLREAIRASDEVVRSVIAHYRTSPTQKVFLLGHSWGAMLATAYINEHPRAIDGAILGEPGGFIWQDVMDYVGRTRDLGMTSEPLNDVMYTDQFFTGNEDNHVILDYKFALMTGVDFDDGNEGHSLIWRMGAVINSALRDFGSKTKPDWTTNLSQYTTKVLFVYSEGNKAYGYDHALKVSSAYPTAGGKRPPLCLSLCRGAA